VRLKELEHRGAARAAETAGIGAHGTGITCVSAVAAQGGRGGQADSPVEDGGRCSRHGKATQAGVATTRRATSAPALA
jgi:hypothetical protein